MSYFSITRPPQLNITFLKEFVDQGYLMTYNHQTHLLMCLEPTPTNWRRLSMAKLDESIIWEFADTLCNVGRLAKRYTKYRLDWRQLSIYQKNLSESLIRNYADRLDWHQLSIYQTNLSESLIREFADRVDWKNLCQCQSLSESLIRDFADTLCRLDGHFVVAKKFEYQISEVNR